MVHYSRHLRDLEGGLRAQLSPEQISDIARTMLDYKSEVEEDLRALREDLATVISTFNEELYPAIAALGEASANNRESHGLLRRGMVSDLLSITPSRAKRLHRSPQRQSRVSNCRAKAASSGGGNGTHAAGDCPKLSRVGGWLAGTRGNDKGSGRRSCPLGGCS